MSNFFVKLTSTLLITCAASVALVAGAHEGTKEIIAKKHEADTKAAYKQVLPDLGDLQKEKAPGDSSAISKNPVKAAKPTVISTLSIPAGTAARSNSWSHRRRERDHYGHQGPEPFGNPGSGCPQHRTGMQAQFKGKSLKNDLVVTKQDPTKDNDIRAITLPPSLRERSLQALTRHATTT